MPSASALRSALLLVFLALAPQVAQAVTCESLQALTLPNTKIMSARSVAAGTFVPPDPMQPPTAVPAFCRVTGVISPTPASSIGFEVWLPVTGAWNRKLLAVGNSGLAGAINFSLPPANLADSLRRGYVGAATDTGHIGGFADGSFGVGQPEKVKDNASRGLHETVLKAKLITVAFYGSDPKRSYYNGCSTGGRQGLLEAQQFPDDFDGIIAGAPAIFLTHLAAQGLFLAQQTLGVAGAYIPASKLPALAAAVLAECDAIDGLSDGLIDDPRKCKFKPATLQCQGPETASCLTQPQVKALQQIYKGPSNPRTGEQIYPGFERGGELGGPLDWSVAITGPAPGQAADIGLAAGFYRGIVFENLMYDILTFDFDADLAFADKKLAKLYNATSTDLSRFRGRGGKLLLYHGWSDAVIAPQNTIDYFQRARDAASQDEPKKGEKPRDFLRLFMAPGMQHCVGGPGPFAFDAVRALEQWVEAGIAPDRIVAAHPTANGTVDRTRPLCPFPQVARYTGTGSINDAANFVCMKKNP